MKSKSGPYSCVVIVARRKGFCKYMDFDYCLENAATVDGVGMSNRKRAKHKDAKEPRMNTDRRG